MDCRMEMDFMGVRRINNNQVEKERFTQHPDDSDDDTDNNNLSLCLFPKSNAGSGILQLSSSSSSRRSNNNVVDEVDQVDFNLGSSMNRNAKTGTFVNVPGSAARPCFGAYNSEKQGSLLRFPCLPNEEVHYASEFSHDKAKLKAASLLTAPKLPHAFAESDIQKHKDKVPASRMKMQWLHWTKAATLQQRMSTKNVEEERPVKRKIDWLTTCSVQPVSTADAFKSNKRCTVGLEKSFTLSPTSNDTPEYRNFQLVANGNPNRHFGASLATAQAFNDPSSLDHSIDQTSSFLRVKSASLPSNFKEKFVCPFEEQQLTANSYGQHLSSDPSTSQTSVWCGVSPSLVVNTQASAASNVPGKEVSAQLTIFYDGTVNVYDDIPPEKAHTIMLLAGNTNSIFAKATNSSPQRFLISTPLAQNGHARPKTPTVCSSMPNSLGTTRFFSTMQNPCAQQVHTQKSQIPFQPGQFNGLSPGDGECQSNQISGATINQQEPAKQFDSGIDPNVIRRALPQARKASLTRFLERRKERVVPNMPCFTKESEHLSSQTKE